MSRFVVFTDFKYSGVCRVLIDSLILFSTADIMVIASGFEFKCDHKRVSVISESAPSDLCDYFNWRLDYLSKLTGKFILLDADMVANRNVDDLFLIESGGSLLIQQPAVCGNFDHGALFAGPTDGVVYCNTVPAICFDGFSNWLIEFKSRTESFRNKHRQIHSGCAIDDERLLNWLRLSGLPRGVMSIVSPDVQMLDSFISGPAGVESFLASSDLYRGRHVTFNFFHGCKEAVEAESIFLKLVNHKSEFRDAPKTFN